MGGKKQKVQPTDYSDIERQKEKELEEQDKLKRETLARRNNLVRRGRSYFSYSAKK